MKGILKLMGKWKMLIYIFLAVILVLGGAGTMFLNQKSFGRLPHGKRLERIERSPNYKNGQFVNEIKTATLYGNKNKFRIWKEFMTQEFPRTVPTEPIESVKTVLGEIPDDRDWIVWFGHSSYLLNLSGRKILVDPVFYLGSPVTFVNRMFPGSNIYKPSDLPNIDYLVITHDHWDHLDYDAVKELESRVGKVVTGLGVGEHFEYWSYDAGKLIELDWWEKADLDKGFEVTATPARHFSGRGLRANKTLWASFVLRSPRRTIFMGGDGGYGSHFKAIGQKFENIDLGILENGQYSENWPFIHTRPKELSLEMKDLNAARYLTVHHSKFCLSQHPYDEPLQNAVRAAEESGKPVLMPKIGEVIFLDEGEDTKNPAGEGAASAEDGGL